MLKIVSRILPSAILVLATTLAVAQQPPANPPVKKAIPADDIFSGVVTVSAPDSLTVVRKVPARPDESRQFVVDKDTKIEGKLKVNARVTVRFKADGAGAIHALRVIVR